mgnify:CR=1 FL=1
MVSRGTSATVTRKVTSAPTRGGAALKSTIIDRTAPTRATGIPCAAGAESPAAFSVPTLTVPAGGTAAFDVTITPNAGLQNGSLYGGYVVLTPQGDNLIVSPADGLVTLIKQMDPPRELVIDDGTGAAGLSSGPVTRT